MGGGGLWKRENTAKGGDHFNVSVDDLIVMKVSEPLEDLFGVEDDGCFIVFQRTPLGAQQRGQTSYKQNTCQPSKGFILKSAILTLNKQKNLFCNGKLSQGGRIWTHIWGLSDNCSIVSKDFFFFTDELNWLSEPPTISRCYTITLAQSQHRNADFLYV